MQAHASTTIAVSGSLGLSCPERAGVLFSMESGFYGFPKSRVSPRRAHAGVLPQLSNHKDSPARCPLLLLLYTVLSLPYVSK